MTACRKRWTRHSAPTCKYRSNTSFWFPSKYTSPEIEEDTGPHQLSILVCPRPLRITLMAPLRCQFRPHPVLRVPLSMDHLSPRVRSISHNAAYHTHTFNTLLHILLPSTPRPRTHQQRAHNNTNTMPQSVTTRCPLSQLHTPSLTQVRRRKHGFGARKLSGEHRRIPT